jgi:hypothetical protein
MTLFSSTCRSLVRYIRGSHRRRCSRLRATPRLNSSRESRTRRLSGRMALHLQHGRAHDYEVSVDSSCRRPDSGRSATSSRFLPLAIKRLYPTDTGDHTSTSLRAALT